MRITIAELIDGRSATHLLGERPVWEDATGRQFAVASGLLGDWVPLAAVWGDTAPPAAAATTEEPLLAAIGDDGPAALAAMGLQVMPSENA